MEVLFIFALLLQYVLSVVKDFDAGVVELVDTLDLGFNLKKSVKIFKMRMWWNW